MPFKRSLLPTKRPDNDVVTTQMVGIGMNFAAKSEPNANIEDTLIYASELGMDEGDLRVLSVLTTWINVHHAHINADRLVRVLLQHPSTRVQAYWSAVASSLKKTQNDRRFIKLVLMQKNNVNDDKVDLLPVGSIFQIARRGEDVRFAGSNLRVPAGTLRDRDVDVLAPGELAQIHRGYRNRIHLGPTWRADVWTVLELTPDLSVAEAARRAYCSFATAWQVAQDFRLLHAL
ncbi:MAG: hypothetical protein GY822_22490 [Deltaproteobacteria bacterium]|nr:hypothetical protein [Deltaproteobacteria bacterium]